MLRSVDKKVQKIKNNSGEINEFIEKNKQFIISSASKVLNRYIDSKNDEEYSIALIAFNEAINTYNYEKGGFLSFAQNIIKFRIMDYLRKESKQKSIILKNASNEEEAKVFNMLDKSSIEAYERDGLSYMRKLEIDQLSEELREYGISFEDLVKASPKWSRTKTMYNELIKASLESEEVMKSLIDKKLFNIKELERLTSLPRKKIERSRKYIIAVIIIISGDYQYLRDYINLEV